MNTKEITTLGLVAVLYVLLSMMVPSLSFGPIQLRLGEMLMVLPFINKKFTISLTLGCFIVNLFSPLGLVDVFFGTSSTLFMSIAIAQLNNQYLIPVVAGLFTGVMIGLELNLVLSLPLIPSILSVGASELVTVALGVVVFNIIKNNNSYIYNLLKIN